MEALSETTRNKDLLKKWIVNPGNREVYIYSFTCREIRDYRVFKGTENAGFEVLENLNLPLEQVFMIE